MRVLSEGETRTRFAAQTGVQAVPVDLPTSKTSDPLYDASHNRFPPDEG